MKKKLKVGDHELTEGLASPDAQKYTTVDSLLPSTGDASTEGMNDDDSDQCESGKYCVDRLHAFVFSDDEDA